MASDKPQLSEQDITAFVVRENLERYTGAAWQGSYTEYLALVSKDPYRHTRTAYQLVYDMIMHFGHEDFEDNGEEVRRFRLFDDPFNGGKSAIYGLERTIERLVQYIRSGAREGGKERIFILHGPVGTAKTSILDLMGRGLEGYTATDEGAVYTFSWRFGKDFHTEGSSGLGFGQAAAGGDYAGFKNPVAVLPSQMHEHPLFLIPRPVRRELITQLFERAGITNKRVIPHKIIEGELDFNSKQIYDFLLRRYKGDWLKVMDHVQVQRMVYSESGGAGIAKIPPEGNVETGSSPVTIDENFKYISNLISSVSLVRYHGKYVRGNRGLVHYSDIFKKPVGYLQHLLSAVEEHKMDFSEVSCDIDVMIIGTTNLAEYSALRADPLSKALRSRMRKIDVPYLLNYQDEEKIYNRGLRMARRYHRIAPHTTEMAALWAVMSRVHKSDLTHSTDLMEETRQVLGKLTPIAKTLLYAGEYSPTFSSKERQQLTREVRRKLRNEFPDEGMDGIPTRILQNLFADLCEDDEADCISPFSVFKLLDQVVEQGPVNFDFLARQRDDSYHDFRGFTTVLRMRYDETISAEIENSIINVDNSEIEGRIREYLRHVMAYNRKEKVRNELTGRDSDPDDKLMRRIEALMDVEDTERDFFRFKMVSRLTNALTGGTGHVKPPDGGTAKIDFFEVYSDVFKAIHRSLYREKRDKINWSNVKRDVEKHSSREQFDKLVEKEGKADHAPAITLLDNMEKTYGYSYECARPVILYFIERRLGAR